MANGVSTKLYIPEIPDNVPPELFAEFTRIYASLRALAVSIDKQTGIYQYDKSAYSQIGAANVKSANVNVAFLKCTAAIPAQRLVGLNASGIFLSTSPDCIGITLTAGAIDEWVPVCLFGALMVTGAVQGTRYYSSGTPGILTTTPGTQFVGYGIEPNMLFFSPALS